MAERLRVMMRLVLVIAALAPLRAGAATLTKDAVWDGVVTLAEDLVVPSGVTLRVCAGTQVRVSPSDSTRTEPEYLSPLTEITVRGTMVVEGTAQKPVRFALAGQSAWAGIIVDGGEARLAHAELRDAESGASVLGGALVCESCVLKSNRYGLSVGDRGRVTVRGGAVRDNEYGIVASNAAQLVIEEGVVRGNARRDRHVYSPGGMPPLTLLADAAEGVATRVLGNDVVSGDAVWSGRIRIEGVVRVPEGSRLVIMPGTVIELARRDTNADGIGENGLLLQGALIAKGTPVAPIYFRSAEKARKTGDWDAINIMNADGAQSLVEYCVIEDAYRGLHFHFANVGVHHALFRNNYRGLQFQESRAEIRDSTIIVNKSGIQARDSEVVLEDNVIAANIVGASFFRVSLTAQRNVVAAQAREGIVVREGAPVVSRNYVDGNRFGLVAHDVFRGEMRDNLFTNNAESGVVIRGADDLGVRGNFVSGNGLYGLNLQDARLVLERNQIAGNLGRGARAVAVSGIVRGNNFMANGVCAFDLEVGPDLKAPGNYWGESDARACPQSTGGQSGKLLKQVPATTPFAFVWPRAEILSAVAWRGRIEIPESVSVQSGASLHIEAGAEIIFAPHTGLTVHGRIEAAGEKGKPVVFTSRARSGPDAWEELLIENAPGSFLRGCVIENATWAVHSHFTDLVVEDCRFRHNGGGIRFRSGPVEIRDSVFEDNEVAIRAYLGRGVISGNRIAGNDIGLFVREQASGLVVRDNDFVGNRRYNVRLGDFNKDDLDARENYWGTPDPAAGIYDAHIEPGIGTVVFEPTRARPAHP